MRKSRSSREQQVNFNEKELRRTKPAATLSLNVARYATEANQHSPPGELCICTLCCIASLMLAGLAARWGWRAPD